MPSTLDKVEMQSMRLCNFAGMASALFLCACADTNLESTSRPYNAPYRPVTGPVATGPNIPVAARVPGLDWTPVSATNDAIYWVHGPSMVRQGQTIRIWEITNWQPNSTVGRVARSVRTLKLFDCRNRSYQTLQYSMHSDYNGQGSPIRSNDSPSPPRYVAPGTAAEESLNRVCRLGVRL